MISLYRCLRCLSSIQSSIIILGLPATFFPSILPSITVFRSESPRRICLIQFVCLFLIVFISVRSSCTFLSTSSLDWCSVHLILRILLQVHISKASSLLVSSFVIVQVYAPYSATLHTRDFTIIFFNSSFSFPRSNSLLLLKASFPIAILFLISV